MTSFRLNELLKYHLEVPGGLGAPAFVIVANKKAIEKLTPENKAALLKASGEAGSALFGKAWQAADEHGRKDAAGKRPDDRNACARGNGEMAADAGDDRRRLGEESRPERI